MFGKCKKVPGTSPEAEQKSETEKNGSGDGGDGEGPSFPWSGYPSSTACNLAAGDLANNLASHLTIDGRVHAETYVAASGTIAGFASQVFTLCHGR